MNVIRIGTRKSPLAMAQAGWVANLIKKRSRRDVELVGIVTEGDQAADQPLRAGGGKGVFVKALDDALLAHTIDLAVHSAKDVPAVLPTGLTIAAIPAREDAGDLLVSAAGWTLETLPTGAQVGTSSLRRSAQLQFCRPDVDVVHLRGNVETRLTKAAGRHASSPPYDAILLAAAGVNRLGGADKAVRPLGLSAVRLDPSEFLPAPGQGALMIVARSEHESNFSFLTDPTTALAVLTERSLVECLGADCNWPLGALAQADPKGGCTLDAAIFSLEGKLRVRDRTTGPGGAEMAKTLAQRLLEKGGKKILDWNRAHSG